MSAVARPLEGKKVALAEGRQLEELAQMLEKEGAKPLRCPLVSILDAPDPVPVLAWLDDVHADDDLRATAAGLRGFFLADPEELSLVALVDQFSSDDSQAIGPMFRARCVYVRVGS